MTRVFDITKAESLPEVALEVLSEARAARVSMQATVLALHGDLGAGKTTFVQTVGRLLGVQEDITSPTFVVMKKYEISETWQKLIHIDAYRLESPEELLVLDLETEISNPENIIFIEWAEKVSEILPADTAHLEFSLVNQQRFLKYNHGPD